MRQLLRKLIVDELGQDLAEYGIALAVITTAIVVTVPLISASIETLWTDASTRIALVSGN